MASRTVWHFAYGSNMNRAQMLARTGKILEEHNASLPNYEVRFNKKVRGGTAGANIQPASGKTVHGVLYKVEEGSMRSLDRYEGVPDHYRRIEVQVTPEGGQPVPAQIYIAQKVEKGLRPSTQYLQAMLDGAGEHNLPASYIGEIKTQPARLKGARCHPANRGICFSLISRKKQIPRAAPRNDTFGVCPQLKPNRSNHGHIILAAGRIPRRQFPRGIVHSRGCFLPR